MADLLALEWEHEQLCGVQAQVSPGQVRVRRCFTLQKPADIDSADSMRVGAWLKDELAKLGVKTEPVFVTLPRDEAVVKRVDLPDVPDDEMPALVRFQAASKSSQSLNELSLDFIPLPRREGAVGREALTATLTKETIGEIRTVCERAGLFLTALGLMPVAVAELVTRAEQPPSTDPHAASLVVSRHGNRVEIFVLARGIPLFAHSTRLSDEDGGQSTSAIVPEVSRAMVALRGLNANIKISHVWTLVPAAEHAPLAGQLGKRLSCPVEALDPFAVVDSDNLEGGIPVDRSLFAGPVGMLLSKSGAQAPTLDFLAPRQPPVRRDPRKRRNVLVGIGAGIAAAVFAVGYSAWFIQLGKTVTERQNTNLDLAKSITKGNPTIAKADLVREWSRENVIWLDEMLELADQVKTDRVYLSGLRFDPETGDALAKVKLEGFARVQQDVMDLNKQIAKEDEKYKVKSKDIPPAKTDTLYPWRLDSEVIVLDPAAQKNKQLKAVPKTAAPGAVAAAARKDQ